MILKRKVNHIIRINTGVKIKCIHCVCVLVTVLIRTLHAKGYILSFQFPQLIQVFFLAGRYVHPLQSIGTITLLLGFIGFIIIPFMTLVI